MQSTFSVLWGTLSISFRPSFAGFKGVWMAAQTMGGAKTSLWQAMGAKVAPGKPEVRRQRRRRRALAF